MMDFIYHSVISLMCVPVEYWSTMLNCHNVVKKVSDE